MKKKPNENNSSVIQALLDLEKVALTSTTQESLAVLGAVRTLKKLLSEHEIFALKTDKIFNKHRYNDNSLHYAKIENYRKNQILLNLTDKEVKVLMYFIEFMSQQNSIAVKQDVLGKYLKLSKPTVIKALNGLETKGCITSVYTDKKQGLGTVYMINPQIATVGKYNFDDLFKKITPQGQLNEFDRLNNCSYDVNRAEISVGNENIKFNIPTKKEYSILRGKSSIKNSLADEEANLFEKEEEYEKD